MATPFPPAGIVLGNPDWGFNEEPEVNVNVVNLGDGYESREPVGINYIRDTLDFTWSSLDPGMARAAHTWLKPRLKWETLQILHPVTGETLRVVAQTSRLTYDEYNNAVLNVTVKTDHNPG